MSLPRVALGCYMVVSFPDHTHLLYEIYLADTTNVFILSLVTDKEKKRKGANIWNQYNQVPHLIQKTTQESHENTNITNECQDASPFRAGGHMAAMNRRKTEITQMIHKRSTILERSVKILYRRV